MSSGKTYKNNASNRRSGRAGKPMGSAKQSKSSSSSNKSSSSTGASASGASGSSGSSSSYSSSSGSLKKTYADNAPNRKIGRVGMDHGTKVVPSSSSASSTSKPKTYVDNTFNRTHDRVGMDHGTKVVPSSSSASSTSKPKTYVDNTFNNTHDRVGMDHGTKVVPSSSSASSTSKPKTYVDNTFNRTHDRVGMDHGTKVVPSSSSASSTTKPKTYVDNTFNRTHDRVGMDHGTKVVPSSSSASSTTKPKTYVDNAYNRRVGRVGMDLRTMPISKNSHTGKKQVKNPGVKLYKDNEANRRIGRVGMPFRTVPVSSKKTVYLRMAFEHVMYTPHAEFTPPFRADRNLESHLSEQFNRIELGISRNQEATKKPFEWYEHTILQFRDLDLGKKIGHGGFGDIHEGHMKGDKVAIKKLRVQRVSQKKLTEFEDEVRIFCKLKHKNIIAFYGACIKTPNLCIVMELMDESLYYQLHVKEYEFSDTEHVFIAMEISNGLGYLHSENVAHCDIKPTNVLINISAEGGDKHEVKITDFGLSKIKNYSETSHSRTGDDDEMVREVGTPRYSAPEVLRGELLNTKGMMMADVYSFGLVIFEIFSQDEVFPDYNKNQLTENVGKGEHMPALNDLESGPLQDLMLKCWERTPTTRPTAGECFASLKEIYQATL
ncbi:uncharacterized protein [Antedon mediterranea]|uniref:uncharacterized protein n=1 Tax=Antedon mediterranea TaxID=105859 RepID=UPI003AF756B3